MSGVPAPADCPGGCRGRGEGGHRAADAGRRRGVEHAARGGGEEQLRGLGQLQHGDISLTLRDNSNTQQTRCCHLHSERHPVPRPPAPAAVEPVLARLLDRVLTHRTMGALANVFLDSGPVSRNFPCTES